MRQKRWALEQFCILMSNTGVPLHAVQGPVSPVRVVSTRASETRNPKPKTLNQTGAVKTKDALKKKKKVEFRAINGYDMRFVLSGGVVQVRSFPLPSEFGTCETVKARFWPLLRLSANQETERSAQAPSPPP